MRLLESYMWKKKAANESKLFLHLLLLVFLLFLLLFSCTLFLVFFSNSLNIQDTVTQPDRIILVR